MVFTLTDKGCFFLSDEISPYISNSFNKTGKINLGWLATNWRMSMRCATRATVRSLCICWHWAKFHSLSRFILTGLLARDNHYFQKQLPEPASNLSIPLQTAIHAAKAPQKAAVALNQIGSCLQSCVTGRWNQNFRLFQQRRLPLSPTDDQQPTRAKFQSKASVTSLFPKWNNLALRGG